MCLSTYDRLCKSLVVSYLRFIGQLMFFLQEQGFDIEVCSGCLELMFSHGQGGTVWRKGGEWILILGNTANCLYMLESLLVLTYWAVSFDTCHIYGIFVVCEDVWFDCIHPNLWTAHLALLLVIQNITYVFLLFLVLVYSWKLTLCAPCLPVWLFWLEYHFSCIGNLMSRLIALFMYLCNVALSGFIFHSE